MTKGYVYIAVSLDGFVAREDGTLDWLMKQNTEGEDFGYEAFMASVDGLVMGRGSYEAVAAFDTWPYKKPVIVMSKSLKPKDIPSRLQGRVSLSSETPQELMHRLETEHWKAAYIDGGLIVQSFMQAGLIDELTLTRVPILLGSGKPLFGPLKKDIDLEHMSTKSYNSGLVHSHYKIS